MTQQVSATSTSHYDSNTETTTRSSGRSRSTSNYRRTHINSERGRPASDIQLSDPILKRVGYAAKSEITTQNYYTKPIEATEKYTENPSHESLHEMQVLAESASFVNPNGGFASNIPQEDVKYNYNINPDNHKLNKQNIDDYKIDTNTENYQVNQQITNPSIKATTIQPTTYSRRGSSRFRGSSETGGITKSDNLVLTTSTPSFREDSYSTAKRLGTTRSPDVPYYTPTVPPILAKNKPFIVPTASRTTTTTTTTEKPISDLKPTDHAIEIMKMLSELDISQDILPPSDVFSGDQPDLAIPPSSGANTLHSLALYFAETVENLKNPNSSDESEKKSSELYSTHLSHKTVQKYDELFGNEDKTTSTESPKYHSSTIISPVRFGSDEHSDLFTAHTKYTPPIQGTSPQIRELAQVFTHALSAYLHNPEDFRKLLQEIRPKPAVPIDNDDILTNRIGRTEPSRYATTPMSTNGATYLPTSTSTPTTTNSVITESNDQEVLDYSDVTISNGLKLLATEATATESDIQTTSDFRSDIESTTFGYDEITTIRSGNQPYIKSAEKTPGSDFIVGNHLKDVPPTNALAMEINGNLILSTSYPYASVDNDNALTNHYKNDAVQSHTTTDKPDVTTTELTESTTELFLLSDINKKFSEIIIPSSDILLPFDDTIDQTTTELYENLQSAHSQSIVSHNQNNLDRSSKKIEKEQFDLVNRVSEKKEVPKSRGPLRGFYITAKYPQEETTTILPFTSTELAESSNVTPNPWADLKYTVFLDPLTINDELMDLVSDGTSTAIPDTTTTTDIPTTEKSDQIEDITIPSNFFPSEQNRRGKSLHIASELPNRNTIINAPMQTMKERANEIFGNLNETQANSLMHVMEQAESNKTVRKLILLLIQTCDDEFNSTVQASRDALLNALISMDSDQVEHEIRIISSKKNSKSGIINDILGQYPSESQKNVEQITSTTTESNFYSENVTPTVQSEFRIDLSEEDEPTSTTFNEWPTTATSTQTSFTETSTQEVTIETTTTPATVPTTSVPFTTTSHTTIAPIQTTLKGRKRTGKSLERYESSAFSNDNISYNKNSDERALELLRSLYSLASRWGQR